MKLVKRKKATYEDFIEHVCKRLTKTTGDHVVDNCYNKLLKSKRLRKKLDKVFREELKRR